MAELVWPQDLLPASAFSWRIVSNTSRHVSKFNGQTQTVRRPGSRWKATLQCNDLPDYESRQLESILLQLDGGAGRIRMGDFGRWGRPSQGQPVVVGANQTGFSLATAGWLPNRHVLFTGDYFEVNGELKLITSDVIADGSGNATLKFGPMLRTSPANGAVIETAEPTGLFMLAEDENGPDRKPAFANDFNITFIEVF